MLAKLVQALNAHSPDGQPVVLIADARHIMVRTVFAAEPDGIEIIAATRQAVADWLGY